MSPDRNARAETAELQAEVERLRAEVEWLRPMAAVGVEAFKKNRDCTCTGVGLRTKLAALVDRVEHAADCLAGYRNE